MTEIERDKAISMVRKLVRTANDKAATPSERETALRIAQSTIDKHQLKKSEVTGVTPYEPKRSSSGVYISSEALRESLEKLLGEKLSTEDITKAVMAWLERRMPK